MINVKGTKSASPEADASQRYVLKSGDEVSRTPHAIGGLLAGIAAYLASIFAEGRENEPQTQSSQPANPTATAAETENLLGVDDKVASRRTSPDPPDSETPDSAMPAVADASPSTTPRPRTESELAPLLAESTSDNASGDKMGPVGGVAGTPPAGDADPVGAHSSPYGGGPSGANSPPDDDQPPEGGASTDDPLYPGGDDDGEVRPGTNRAPRVSGPVYLLDVAPCATLLIAFDDLLSNAADPDGDVLSIQNPTVSSGTLTQAEGGWIFESGTGLTGPVILAYEITDGEHTIEAVAHFSVVEQPVVAGTSANDMFLGSMCADEIDGAGGNDNIDGRAGDDVIAGGMGDDHIVAGDGNDMVVGGDGNDIIFGRAGSDHLFGGSGNDRLFGEDGDDVIFGNAGEDRLSGGDGDDLLLGGNGTDSIHGDGGSDTLVGGAGDDALFGEAGQDVIDGGDGEDVIVDGAGRDQVFGGLGNDWVVASLDSDDDVYDGGGGSDTLDYDHATEALVIDLVNGVADGVEIGHDSLTGFDYVLGGRGDDQFIFGGGSITVTGGAGDDVFRFASAGQDRPNLVSHEIMDFEVGDRIRISEYDIFRKADDEPEDRFGRIYRDDGDNDPPIRYRHDRDDEIEMTAIDTDFDGDDVWATAVTLRGTHNLSWWRERDDALDGYS